MALKFRRSKKLLPGVKLNLNKKSASVTIGPKWLHTTYSTTGKKTTTVGIPGTGISNSSSTGAAQHGNGHMAAEPVHEPITSEKSRTISLILCIFTVCGHRIYTGKIGTAILYLFTIGLFGIGWISDIVKICTGKFTDANGDYVEKWNTKSTLSFVVVFAGIVVLGYILSALGAA